jgi:L-serine deaminase
MSDPRRASVERAVNAAALALLARDQTVAEVVAALTNAVAGDIPADVTPPMAFKCEHHRQF